MNVFGIRAPADPNLPDEAVVDQTLDQKLWDLTWEAFTTSIPEGMEPGFPLTDREARVIEIKNILTSEAGKILKVGLGSFIVWVTVSFVALLIISPASLLVSEVAIQTFLSGLFFGAVMGCLASLAF